MLKSLIALFLESNCPLCDRTAARDIICNSCNDRLSRSQLKGKYWHERKDIAVFAWGNYGGELKRAIAAVKYQNCPELGELMGLWLGRAWCDAIGYSRAKKMIVVPIPIHPKKLKQRGYNQAESIGRGFCKFTGYPMRSRGLKRKKYTQAMFDLTPQQRQENIKSAFVIGGEFDKQPPRSPVILIDDICTTGNTLAEAAKILRDRGIEVFGAATVSITSTGSNNLKIYQ